MQNVLITGSNRGIGLAFVKHYLSEGATVFAACRKPESAEDLHELQAQHKEKLHIVQLDVSHTDSIQTAVEWVASHIQSLDLLVNNAAVFHRTPFEEMTAETSLNTFHINAVAPMMVSRAFLELLKRSQNAVILNVSSNRASISEKTDRNLIDYSASKAAMNSYTRSLAVVAAENGMTAVMIDPGWVQTRMGGMEATLTPEQTVKGMVSVIANLTPEQNGKFYNWDGSIHAW